MLFGLVCAVAVSLALLVRPRPDPSGAGALPSALALSGAPSSSVASPTPGSPDSPLPPALSRAEALRKEGKLDEAEAAAAPHLEHEDPRARAAAAGIVARIHLRRGRTDDAIAGLTLAASLHRGAARSSEALRDELALVYACLYQGRRFADARAALERAEGLAPAVPDGLPGVRYFRGLLAYETGDLRSALPPLRDALSGPDYRTSALQVLAFVLQVLGREGEGEALLAEAERSAEAADPCTRADLLANIAWFRVRSRRGPAGAAELLDRTLALREQRCPGASARAHVLTDYAVLHLREGRDADARRRLEQSRSAVPEPDGALLAAWLDVEGQLATRSGDHREALSIFDRLAGVAEAGLMPVASWRAALGRARALDALGRPEEAGRAHEAAEALVARSSLLVPADEGRVGYLGAFDEGARAAVTFFLRRDPATAAKIARRARARALASLRWTDRVAALHGDDRVRWDRAMAAYRSGRAALEAAAGDYWKLTAPDLAQAVSKQREAQTRLTRQLDEAISALYGGALPGAEALPEPGPGELMLVYHTTDRGLVGFAVTRGGTLAKELPPAPPGSSPDQLAAALLFPFRESIQRASRVRFIVPGALEDVDLHALPWDGAPLLATVPVLYGTDAGSAAAPASDVPASPRSDTSSALLVADPRGDLPATRQEARIVAEALRRAGVETRLLSGQAATYSAVREAIEAAPLALLHYAGHGQFEGEGGWDSKLRLAEGGSLSVGDAISLRSAPAVVVLSGCETGRAGSGSAAGGLGIAHAFVVAGARAVVAASRPVDDALAARVAAALYEPSGPDVLMETTLAERLRAAQLAARSAAPAADWSAFRMLVP